MQFTHVNEHFQLKICHAPILWLLLGLGVSQTAPMMLIRFTFVGLSSASMGVVHNLSFGS